jgi:hypothetical protein
MKPERPLPMHTHLSDWLTFFDVSIDYLVGRTQLDLSSDKKKIQLLDEIISNLNELKDF